MSGGLFSIRKRPHWLWPLPTTQMGVLYAGDISRSKRAGVSLISFQPGARQPATFAGRSPTASAGVSTQDWQPDGWRWPTAGSRTLACCREGDLPG